MYKYIVLFLLSSAAWGVKTVARVGQSYITDYDLHQAQKVLSWLNKRDVTSEEAQANFFYLQQVNAYAAEHGVKISSEQKKELFAHFAQNRGLSADQLSKELADKRIDIQVFDELLQGIVLDSDLMKQHFQDELSPSQQDIAAYKKGYEDSQEITAQAISAKDVSELSFNTWPKEVSSSMNMVSYNTQKLSHLPDAYQKEVRELKSGQTSKVFQAHGKYHIIRVTKKSEMPNDSEIKALYMQNKAKEMYPQWQSELIDKHPVISF